MIYNAAPTSNVDIQESGMKPKHNYTRFSSNAEWMKPGSSIRMHKDDEESVPISLLRHLDGILCYEVSVGNRTQSDEEIIYLAYPHNLCRGWNAAGTFLLYSTDLKSNCWGIHSSVPSTHQPLFHQHAKLMTIVFFLLLSVVQTFIQTRLYRWRGQTWL